MSVRNQRILLIIILIATLLVYLPSLKFGFYTNLDDGKLILDNKVVNYFGEHKNQAFTEFVYGLYHPLTTISFVVDHKIWGSDPFGFRLTNLLLHLFNIILVYVFVLRLLKKPFIALFSSLIFALHPMHLESVIWVSERKDVLFTFFFLLSLIFYLRSLEKGKAIDLILVNVFFLCSLLSKASAVVLPLILVSIDYYYQKPIFKSVLRKSHLLALSVLFGIINIKAQNSINFIQDIYQPYSFLQKISLPLYAFTYYLVGCFAPVGLAAKNLYPRVIDGSIAFVYYTGWIWIILLGVLVYRFKQNRFFILGLLFYAINIILVIKIIPTGNDIVSNRYAYLPHIGISMVLGYFITVWVSEKIRWLNWIIIAITITLTALSIQNRKYWKDEVTIWTRIIEREPQMILGWHQVGKALLDERQYKNAEYYYTKSIELDAGFYPGYIGRGLCRYYERKNELSLADFSKAISLDSTKPDGYYNRGNLFIKLEKYKDARKDLQTTLRIDNSNMEAVYYLGIAELNLREFDNAIQHFTEYINYNPHHPRAQLDLAICYYHSGKFSSAEKEINEYMASNPNNGEAMYYQGNLLAKNKKFKQAIEVYNKLILINPDFGGVYLNRGNSYLGIGELSNACADWHIALQKGVIQAQTMLDQHCK